MKPYVTYLICPTCGEANFDLSCDCRSCGTKLESEDAESHERFVAHLRGVKSEVGFYLALLAFGLIVVVTVMFIPVIFGSGLPFHALVGIAILLAMLTYRNYTKFKLLRSFLGLADTFDERLRSVSEAERYVVLCSLAADARRGGDHTESK